jgi:uncharacterized protein (DUF1684 family)
MNTTSPAVATPTTPTTETVSPSVAPITFGEEREAWHAEHDAQRAAPHGFLSVTGLHFLTADSQRFADAPGAWSATEAGPVVELADGEQLTLNDVPLAGRHEFGDIAERAGLLATAGDAVIEIARRGGHLVVRPRHPGAAFRAEYRGTPTYPPHPRWLAAARFLAFDVPREVTVGAAVEGLRHVYEAPGELEFSVGGETFRLTAFNGQTPGSLLVLFTDATSGVTTYAANRAISVDAPGDDGVTTIDFNRAVNLPCAYTDHATCPLPPAENRLPFGIEAGEKAPLARVRAEI